MCERLGVGGVGALVGVAATSRGVPPLACCCCSLRADRVVANGAFGPGCGDPYDGG